MRGSEVESHHLVEERVGLGRGEAKVGGSQLDELATAAQAGQRQRWVGAGRDGDRGPGWKVVEQEGQRFVDLGRFDHVVVVQRENGRSLQQVQIVDQADQDRLGGQGSVGVQQRGSFGAHFQVPQRRDKVDEEPAKVVVLAVERQPGLAAGCGEPLAHQCCLAESSRRGHQDQSGPRSLIDPERCGQARAGHQFPARQRDVELRPEDRSRLACAHGRTLAPGIPRGPGVASPDVAPRDDGDDDDDEGAAEQHVARFGVQVVGDQVGESRPHRAR